jgi:hypothetical protein
MLPLQALTKNESIKKNDGRHHAATGSLTHIAAAGTT